MADLVISTLPLAIKNVYDLRQLTAQNAPSRARPFCLLLREWSKAGGKKRGLSGTQFFALVRIV